MSEIDSSTPILGGDACDSSSASDAASTACSENFRGTTPTAKGHILVKTSPGDKCLKHLDADEKRFVLSDPACGSEQTTQPDVAVPAANPYQKDVQGNILKDSAGNPIRGAAPKFQKVWVSAVVEEGENKLFVLEAPDSDTPLFLRAKDGYFELVERTDDAVGAAALPTKASAGRLLLVNKVPDCDGSSWTAKELSLDLEEDQCATLTVTKDAEGYTQVGFTVPSAVAGFLRTNPDDPCAPVSGDVLSEAEAEQFTRFMEQIFCDPALPSVDSYTISRVVACGSKTDGEVVTTGLQPFTLKQLFEALEALRQSDPDVSTDPVDTEGDPLVDGESYNAVYNATTKQFVYRPAYRERRTSYSLLAEYTKSNVSASESQVYSPNLTTLGINATDDGFNYAEILFNIDVRGRGNASSDELWGYVKTEGTIRGWAGARSLGQTTLSTGVNDHWGENTFSYLVPIVANVASFELGLTYNHNDPRNEIKITAHLLAIKRIPS